MIIPLHVYPFEIMFSIAESEEGFRKSLENFGAEWNDALELEGTALGRATLLPCNRSVIRLVRFPQTARDYAILAHEIFHIIHYLLRRIGMEWGDQSDEAYAYLISYITEEVYKEMGFRS